MLLWTSYQHKYIRRYCKLSWVTAISRTTPLCTTHPDGRTEMTGNTSTQAHCENWTVAKPTEPDLPLSLVAIFYAAGVLVCIATLVGNLFVIISFAKFPVLRTTSNYFLLSLAIADGTSGPATMLFLLLNLATGFQINSKFTHMLCVLAVNLNAVAYSGSLFSVMGVACERYVKVIYSLRYVY